ncbi:type II toxin-antitoxin system RelE/ParE family toxin [Patescibacteria group bacterium]|nr:type II toxin-antitoxin system RelE/ParE family toxin [Patescibacteria group bacterium]MBU1885960.1 type II toxin-antitoxin system RelE/ParE family toxin [Patescibacteria group bacterium]
MKKIIFGSIFDKKLKILKKKNLHLYQQIKKTLQFFSKNHRHPSLRCHKLKGQLQNVWSISVNRSVRLLYIEEVSSYYFFDLGTHKEVYA